MVLSAVDNHMNPAPSRDECAPLVFTAAFAGHRPVAYRPGGHGTETDGGLLASALETTYGLLRAAAQRIADHRVGSERIFDSHIGIGQATGNQPELRLLSGYAEGADRIAVDLWRGKTDQQLGLVFPFLDPSEQNPVPTRAYTHAPDQEGRFAVDLQSLDLKANERVTVLDGDSWQTEYPPRSAHLEQARFLVRWADLLIVFWDGAMPRGSGGTGDTLRLAIAKGIPILWIDQMDIYKARLINPAELWSSSSLLEIVEGLATDGIRDAMAPLATAEALVDALLPAFTPPTEVKHKEHGGHVYVDKETEARRDFASDPRVKKALLWRIASALAPMWNWLIKYASGEVQKVEGRGDTRFIDKLPSAISFEVKRAEELAYVSGNAHRLVQMSLLVLAVLAVACGTLPAIFPEKKIAFVGLELVVLLLVFGLWGLRSVGNNHRRWSDTRRYAERLRAIAATWHLGVDANDFRTSQSGTWTEWRARALLRHVGPPSGCLDRSTIIAHARQVRDDPYGLLSGQSAYHQTVARRNGKIAHRVEKIEEATFVFLVISIVSYLVWKIASGHFPEIGKPPMWVGNLLLVCSAVIPAIAAACLGIEAKIGFEEVAVKSERLAPQFEELCRRLSDDQLTPAKAQEILIEAARLHCADADSWRDGLWRRRMAKL